MKKVLKQKNDYDVCVQICQSTMENEKEWRKKQRIKKGKNEFSICYFSIIIN